MRKTIKQVKKAVAALMALVMVLGVGVPVMADTTKVIELPATPPVEAGYGLMGDGHAVRRFVNEVGTTMILNDVIKTTTVPVSTWDAVSGTQMGEMTVHWVAQGSEITFGTDLTEFFLSILIWERQGDGVYQGEVGWMIIPDDWDGHAQRIVVNLEDNEAMEIGNSGVLIKSYIVSEGAPVAQPTPTPTNNIAVTINGDAVDFADQQPALVDGRTLVPVRGVFEQLGFEVDWDNENRQAILERDDYIIIITIDSEVFTTNGVEHRFDVPAQTIGGRTMVPIRFVLESVGYELDWDGDTQTVIISTN